MIPTRSELLTERVSRERTVNSEGSFLFSQFTRKIEREIPGREGRKKGWIHSVGWLVG